MEPRIQYAKTADEVSIAFWTLGQGPPLVFMPWAPFSHVQVEWQNPDYRRLYERLADRRMLVRYDSRGAGLSDRDVPDYSLDCLVLDLEAVVDRLGLERVALFAPFYSGLAAIAYAARHPERVSQLVLWHCWARASDTRSSEQRGLRGLLDSDWELFTETLAHVVAGWSEGEAARRAAAVYRESVTQQTMQAFIRAMRSVDVTVLLPQVRSPTLVLRRRQASFPQVDVARGLASRIPDARLAMLEGSSGAPFLGGTESVAAAIDEFVGEGEEAAAAAEPLAKADVHTILFTDMQSSTTLRQRLGDTEAQELVRIHNTIVRDALKAHGGNEIKHTGDGIMASFPTASGALQCAVAIQRGVAAHVEDHPEAPLGVYIGLNAGEPIAEERDLFGTSVDLARRICDHAGPGEIVVSDVVRQLAAGKGFLFSDRGETVLRGFEDPVRLYEVRWKD